MLAGMQICPGVVQKSKPCSMMHWLVRLPSTVPAADSMFRLQLTVPIHGVLWRRARFKWCGRMDIDAHTASLDADTNRRLELFCRP